MRIFQIYLEFRIFDLPDFVFLSGYDHRHISGSLTFIKIIFRIFWSGHSHLCILVVCNHFDEERKDRYIW